MTSAPPGALVTIAPYDWAGKPREGDFLVTPAGSAYEILDATAVRTRRFRWRLRCVKLAGVQDVPPDARVLSLYWYPRKRARPRS